MRLSTVLAVLLLGLGAMLLPSSGARSAAWLGSGYAIDGSLAELMLKVKSEKKVQKEMNQGCGAGKVFVQNRGCVKKENAEKAKASEKAKEAEKAKSNLAKSYCQTFKEGKGTVSCIGGGPTTCNKLANGDSLCCCKPKQ